MFLFVSPNILNTLHFCSSTVPSFGSVCASWAAWIYRKMLQSKINLFYATFSWVDSELNRYCTAMDPRCTSSWVDSELNHFHTAIDLWCTSIWVRSKLTYFLTAIEPRFISSLIRVTVESFSHCNQTMLEFEADREYLAQFWSLPKGKWIAPVRKFARVWFKQTKHP